MKKFMSIFLCAVALSSVFVNNAYAKEEKGNSTGVMSQGIRFDSSPFFDKTLKDVLAPKVQVLDFDSIASRASIHAYTVALDCMEGPSFLHIGKYCNARIETRIGCAGTGCINPEIGEQIVFFYSGACCYKFHSNTWSIEKMNDETYIVHSYDTFKVYSSDHAQFVVSN